MTDEVRQPAMIQASSEGAAEGGFAGYLALTNGANRCKNSQP